MKSKKTFKYFLFLMSVLIVFCSCSPRKNTPAIGWIYDLDSAITLASESQKPLMIDFMATWCPPCKAMEESTFVDADVILKSRNYVTVRIDVDKQPDIANKYNGNARKYGGVGIPNLLFLTSQQDTLKHIIGYYSPSELANVMDSVIMVFNSSKSK